MTETVTIAYAREQLDLWLEALQSCSAGQSYSIGGRTLTRQDTATIRDEISRWSETILDLEARADGRVRSLGAKGAHPTPGSGQGPANLYPDSIWRDWRT